MSQIIKLKQITTPNYVPTVDNLVLGEVALDTAEGKLYAIKGTEGNYAVEQLNTVADLSNIRITHVYPVSDEAAVAALADADEGDVAVLTGSGESYIHTGGTTGTIADWIKLNVHMISSVNGQEGTVLLDASNIEPVADRQYVTAAQKAILEEIEANGYDGGSISGGENPQPMNRSRLVLTGATNAAFNTAFLIANGGMTLNGNSLVASNNYATYISSDGTNNLGLVFNSATNEYNLISTLNPISSGTDIVIDATEILGASVELQENVNYPISQGIFTLVYGN